MYRLALAACWMLPSPLRLPFAVWLFSLPLVVSFAVLCLLVSPWLTLDAKVPVASVRVHARVRASLVLFASVRACWSWGGTQDADVCE